jgi:hypothetical protein
MRKALYSLCAVLGMAATTLVAAPAQAIVIDLPIPPPSDKIVIDVITVNGTGCPAGSAAIAMAPDNTAFTVTYSKYKASIGVGHVSTNDARKNCQINVVVQVPSGFTYAIASTDFRGFHQLQGPSGTATTGASAQVRANYYFQGDPQTAQTVHTYTWKDSDPDWGASYQFTDNVAVASLVWHPCGALRNLNINTELRAAAGGSDVKTTTSDITLDSVDGEINTKYNFQWRNC